MFYIFLHAILVVLFVVDFGQGLCLFTLSRLIKIEWEEVWGLAPSNRLKHPCFDILCLQTVPRRYSHSIFSLYVCSCLFTFDCIFNNVYASMYVKGCDWVNDWNMYQCVWVCVFASLIENVLPINLVVYHVCFSFRPLILYFYLISIVGG